MWPWRKSAKQHDTDPKRAHPFRETDDAGLGSFASGGFRVGQSQVNQLAVTTGFLRATRCAMPGCGKERHDPIHAPADPD